MTKVKICGITNLEDARLAVELGAFALGFNFYEKSPRYIAPQDARKIIEELPGGIYKVGVFVNEPVSAIAQTVSVAGLDAVQLHGDETPEFVIDLKQQTTATVIKAFRVKSDFNRNTIDDYKVDAVMLDAYSNNEFGGTGKTFNWEIAKRVKEPLYLAGGIGPENVVDAIQTVHPFAVDVCSSIESSPGKKAPEKLKQLFARIKNDG